MSEFDFEPRLLAAENRARMLRQNPAPTVPQYDLGKPSEVPSIFYIGNVAWIGSSNVDMSSVVPGFDLYPLPFQYITWFLSNQYAGSFYQGSYFMNNTGVSPQNGAVIGPTIGSANATNLADSTWHNINIVMNFSVAGFDGDDYHDWDVQMNYDGSSAVAATLRLYDNPGWATNGGQLFDSIQCCYLNAVYQYIDNLSLTTDSTTHSHDFNDGTLGPFSTVGSSWIVTTYAGHQCAHGHSNGFTHDYLYRDFSSPTSSLTIDFDFNSGPVNP